MNWWESHDFSRGWMSTVYSTEQQHKTLRQNLDPTFINTQNITQKLTREQLDYDFGR